jgi:hypothetical protein
MAVSGTNCVRGVAGRGGSVSNTFMRAMPQRMRSPGLKLLVLFVAGCGAGLGLITWLRTSNHKITDQELLREAIAEWKRAGEPGEGPNYRCYRYRKAIPEASLGSVSCVWTSRND